MSQRSGLPNQDLTVTEIFKVKGFKAVVTGGGSGIGLMITQALVANGADVFITGRTEDKLETVAKTYSGVGIQQAGTITPIVTDVTSKDSIKQLVAKVTKACPDGIQLLVNNAGVALDDKTKLKNFQGDDADADQLSSFFFNEGDPQAWADTFATNTTALFFTSWAFLPLLAKGLSRPGAGSSIINITSISGLNKKSGSGQFAYATSKAAANHLTKMLAQQLLPTKVRVNAIAPGLFPSEMTAGSSGPDQKTDPSQLDDSIVKSRPAGRAGGETDIGAAVLYLASPGGNFVNGQVLPTDGGSLLTMPSVM